MSSAAKTTATRLLCGKEAAPVMCMTAGANARTFPRSVVTIAVFLLIAAAIVRTSDSAIVMGRTVEQLKPAFSKDGAYIPTTRFYDFDVRYTNKTVNCVNKALLLVNGQFPGPPIYAVEGDRIVVNVTNHGDWNMTIHWHGVHQRLTGWQDGTAYITQCPLQPGDHFTYNFTVAAQRGTAFWHAHVNWQRATVHGPIVVYPASFSYPFGTPTSDFPVVIAEWWNADVEQVELAGLLSGGPFATADAVVINGLPGPKYNCTASEGISTIQVSPEKTYILRIINAALNTEFFFEVANHTLTVVEVDSEYVSPFQTSTVFIGPGQTTNVLITTRQLPAGSSFYMAAKSFKSQIGTDYIDFTPAEVKWGELDFPFVAASALVQYTSTSTVTNCTANVTATTTTTNGTIPFPRFPRTADMEAARAFQDKLRTLYPGNVPQTVDRYLFYAVGISFLPCIVPPQNCTYRVAASINNMTFVDPTIALLQAEYFHIPGVFSTDFPDNPKHPFNYTYPESPPMARSQSLPRTKVSVIDYGQTVQLVLQDTMVFQFANHPFHLHGYSFYVIGQGTGNYDPETSPATFNTYDPPARFTVDVPSSGWVAIRFKATNPGMWLFHCHLDKHVSWGMEMAFFVKNGVGANETISLPPRRLPPC